MPLNTTAKAEGLQIMLSSSLTRTRHVVQVPMKLAAMILLVAGPLHLHLLIMNGAQDASLRVFHGIMQYMSSQMFQSRINLGLYTRDNRSYLRLWKMSSLDFRLISITIRKLHLRHTLMEWDIPLAEIPISDTVRKN